MRKLWACSASMLMAVALVPPSFAQKSDGNAGLELEEIIVTAEKREVDLQKTSISIQTYSGEELRKTGKKRIDEIMNGVVGVAAQDSQVGVSFTIRGVASVEGGPPGGSIVGTSIPVLIDGVAQSRGEVVRGGTLDVKQAEVMRGPQSTNLGASAMAGAVSLVTNQPVFEYQASGLIEMGNYDLKNLEGVINVPLNSNNAIRFAYSSNKRNGYISSGAGDSDLTNMRLKYRWQASDNLDVVLIASQNKIGGNGVQAGVLLSQGRWVPWADQVALGYSQGPAFTAAAGYCSPDPSNAQIISTMGCAPLYVAINDGTTFRTRSDAWNDGYPRDAWPNNPFRDTTINSYSANIDWNVGIGTLTILPSAENSHFRSMEPPRGTFYMAEDVKQDTRQVEVRLASNNTSRFEWLGGLYYYYTNRYGTQAGISYPGDMGACDVPPMGTTDLCWTWSDTKYSKQTTYSGFANGKFNILDNLRLIGGLRYSHDTKTFVADSSGPQGLAGTSAGPSSAYNFLPEGKGTWKATTYRGGIEYDVLPQTMLYLTQSTGYQPGTATQTTDMSGVTTTTVNPALKLTQTTLGLKSRFFDNKLQFNFEVFNSEYKNRPIEGQISAVTAGTNANTACSFNAGPPGSGPVLQANADCAQIGQNNASAPKLISRGVDVELSWLPTSNDRLDSTIEYLKANYNSRPLINGYGTSPFTAAQIVAAGGSSATAAELATSLNAQLDALGKGVLQNSPKWSLNTSYQHAFVLPGGSKLTPRVNWVYKSMYWSFGNGPGANLQQILADTSNLAWQHAYNRYEAYLAWDAADGKFSINAYAKNLTNEVILTNYGGSYVSLDAPRTFGVILQASF